MEICPQHAETFHKTFAPDNSNHRSRQAAPVKKDSKIFVFHSARNFFIALQL